MKIRKAEEKDVNAICAIDDIARINNERRRFIHDSVHEGTATVAESSGDIVGYSVLEHSFFCRGFIAMLMVRPDFRRTGVGTALVRHVEKSCRSDRIFTSTNQSNLPMQRLLKKLGYRISGKVEDLDPGDPELFFSRLLRVK